jgi:phosphoribosyl 1,2-cyclic phosphodiesterase
VRIAILGSGSKGNCLVIDGGGVVLLVDAGFAPREIRARLRHLDLDLTDVDALLVTHGHGDHVKGARQLAGSLAVSTYATEETRRFVSTFTAFKHHVPIEPGVRFTIGGLRVLPVKTVHDEPGSVAYVVDDGDHAFAVCTDLGTPSEEVGRALHGVDSLLLEFNHDPWMLQHGPYPSHLKRRVGSRFGHLKNDDGARLLAMARSTALSRVLCAHLSEVNNTPDKALAAARPVVDGADVDVACAPQHAPTGWLRVRRRDVAAMPVVTVTGAGDRGCMPSEGKSRGIAPAIDAPDTVRPLRDDVGPCVTPAVAAAVAAAVAPAIDHAADAAIDHAVDTAAEPDAAAAGARPAGSAVVRAAAAATTALLPRALQRQLALFGPRTSVTTFDAPPTEKVR